MNQSWNVTKTALAVLLALSRAPAVPQTDQPYKGQQTRRIKSLSESDIEWLLEGKGMGLAKAAELNRYPGPMHVLQLRGELKLTQAQEVRTRAAMETMRKRAKRLGQKIVEAEAALDKQFASGRAEVDRVRALTRRIGELQGDLRLSHLEAHLAMKKILSESQIEAYVRLRGYGG